MNQITQKIYDGLDLLPKDLQGWNGNSPFFHRVIDEKKPTTIIEVGTWKGQSAINMANHCKKTNLNTKIFCVDTWLGAIEFWTSARHTSDRNLLLKNGYPQIYYQFLSNVVHCGLQDYIRPVPMPSVTAAQYFSYFKISAEVIYIDASHEKGDVYRDIETYWPLLKKGGIMIGDDMNRKSWPGVTHDVHQFVNRNKLKLEIPHNKYWLIRKNGN